MKREGEASLQGWIRNVVMMGKTRKVQNILEEKFFDNLEVKVREDKITLR